MKINTSLLICFLFFLSGCSSLSSLNPFSTTTSDEGLSSAEDTKDENKEAIAPSQLETQKEMKTSDASKKTARVEGTSTLEVLWQVPSEAVEKYHFYYGLSSDKLDNHIVVPISELQKSDHPKHGPVYRYELREIPANRAIYLSLRAENEFGISDPSPPTKVEPGQKSVSPK